MEDEIEDMEEDNLDEEEDGDDVDDEDEGDDAEILEKTIKPKGRRKPRSVLTGRGVTLGMLLDDGVMEPGEKCLSIDYLVSVTATCRWYYITFETGMFIVLLQKV